MTSALWANSAINQGGGIYNNSTLTVVSSFVSGNSARSGADLLMSGGDLTQIDSVISIIGP
jgi:hypothetical protein